MKRNLLLMGFAALSLASCTSGFKKGEGGLMYNIHNHKDGPTIKEGDFISARVVTKTEQDSVLFSTYELDITSEVKVGKPSYKGDLFTGLMLLSEGDSATIKIDLDSSAKASGQPKPPTLKGKYIIYELKIVKVLAKDKMTDQQMDAKIAEFYKVAGEKSRKDEIVKIQQYITTEKLKVNKTPSGLNYEITKEGTGEKPAVGDTAEVIYTMKLRSGKVFDTSVKKVAEDEKIYNASRDYKPLRIPVGVGQVIPGWDEGLQLLKKGSKAIFVVPSNLAYGEQGSGNTIPPFTTLVFEVELVDVIHPVPGVTKPLDINPPTKQPAAK
ncbi:MAG: FKBP-type peptidyl-prolyl cis-trans isomerase [Sphingobacteriaceae bacterium]